MWRRKLKSAKSAVKRCGSITKTANGRCGMGNLTT
jgi:hypothetical protein